MSRFLNVGGQSLCVDEPSLFVVITLDTCVCVCSQHMCVHRVCAEMRLFVVIRVITLDLMLPQFRLCAVCSLEGLIH
jgi:hypothetical protein